MWEKEKAAIYANPIEFVSFAFGKASTRSSQTIWNVRCEMDGLQSSNMKSVQWVSKETIKDCVACDQPRARRKSDWALVSLLQQGLLVIKTRNKLGAYSNHSNQWKRRSILRLSPPSSAAPLPLSSVARLLFAESSFSPSRLSSSPPAVSVSAHARKAPTAGASSPGLRLSYAEGSARQARAVLERRMTSFSPFDRFSLGLMWGSMRISSPLKMLIR